MTDLEMTRLCAEAMGIDSVHVYQFPPVTVDDKAAAACGIEVYWPLKYDAQAMALVKKFRLCGFWDHSTASGKYLIYATPDGSLANATARASHNDMNRAIVECVAKIQAASKR